jgi:hypothetical protein
LNDSIPGHCLLDYAVISEPFPLYAPTSDDTPPATLHIVVSNGGGDTVYCREILFSLPHGELAQSLVDSYDGTGSAEDWTVERVQEGAEIVLPPGDYAHFLAKAPRDGTPLDRSGLTITLRGLHITKHPGTARIEVRETATTDLGNWPDNPGFTTCTITKFPAPAIPVQLVTDFHAEQCEVSAGGDVRLVWRGPDTVDYNIRYGGGAQPKQNQSDTFAKAAGSRGSLVKDFEWNGTVTRDTTFHLTYVIAGTTHYLTTTVTVADPQLTGLRVTGSTVTDGSVTVGGFLTARNDLSVEYGGNAKLTTSGLDGLRVTGGLEAKRSLRVDGALTASGMLDVTGKLTAGGELVVNGDLTANGYVTAVAEGKYFRIRELRGPWGVALSINSTVNVLKDNSVDIHDGLSVGGDIRRGGNGVLAANDTIGLHNQYYPGWFYATMFVDDNRREVAVWNPNVRTRESFWTVSRD